MRDYLLRLDQDEHVVLYDRSMMKDVHTYQGVVAQATERGALIVQHDDTMDATAPTSKADALAMLADPVRRAERVKTYEPGHKPFRSSIPRQLTGHVDPVHIEE